jgi:hypothetical protein
MEIHVSTCTDVGLPERYAYERLQLIIASELAENQNSDPILVDSQLRTCGGLGAYGFEALFWSANSRYFYYTTAGRGVPDGACAPWYPPLYRFEPDISASTVPGGRSAQPAGETLIPQMIPMGSGPVSSDGKFIATWLGKDLVVWDVEAGELARMEIDPPGFTPGAIAWSPDSRFIVYLQTSAGSVCSPGEAAQVDLVRVELPGLAQERLFKTSETTFIDVSWAVGDVLTLTDLNFDTWLYNLSTGELRKE